MPIYEYRCEKCGEVTEQLVLGTDETRACTRCGSADLVKLMSAANVGAASPSFSAPEPAGGCCGSPGSCGAPGSCCSG
jgi:putative FmdB family regulatory protein